LSLQLPRIYAIADARVPDLSHKEQVERLIEGGIELIQLRDKYASPRQFYEAAKAAVEFARSRKVRIIINDRVDIALAVGAVGVHLGQTDLPPKYARDILGPEAIIGFSAHSLDQAIAALNLPIDYLAIGPVFPTATKENPDSIVGLETIKTVKKEIGDLSLVAIGGIDSENLESVLAAGADSAALVSALISDARRISENAEMLISRAKSVTINNVRPC
jgi:thiamine-phosphate pyrophosphorylase